MNRIALCALAGLASLAPVSSAALAQETVRVGWIPAVVSAPIAIAKEKGYFKEVGIDLELELINSAATAMPLLATNRLQALEGGTVAGLFNGMIQGLPIIIASDRGSTPLGHGLVIRPDLKDQIKSLKDMKGRAVAINATGSILQYEWDKLLQSVGLTINDIVIKQIPANQLSVAFANKVIDATIIWTPIHNELVLKNLAVPLMDPDDALPFTTIAVTIINTDWARQKPELVKKFFVALGRGVHDFCQAYHNGPNRAEIEALMLKTRSVQSAEVLRYFWGSRKADGDVNVDSIVEVVKWYQQQGLVRGQIANDKLVDNSFVEHAKSVLGPFKVQNTADKTPGCLSPTRDARRHPAGTALKALKMASRRVRPGGPP